MRRTGLITATAVIGATALLAGCGGGSPSADAGSVTTVPVTASTGTGDARDAAAEVSRAYATLRATSYVSTGATTQEVDASGIDASLRDQVEEQFAAGGAGLSTRTRFESPDRVEITQTVGDRAQEVVLYDGTVFVSPDGTTWARVTGDAADAFSQASAVAGLDPASLFTDLRLDGTATIDGAPATRYSGMVDTAAAGQAAQSVIGGLGQLGAAVGDAVTLRSGTVELQVADSTGTVARQDITMEIAFDFGALARAAGQEDAADLGTMVITSAATERITDLGGDVVVKKPTASTTVSSLVDLGEFLAS